MGKDTLRYSLYTAAVVIITTLTGLFDKFANRDIIPDVLSLNMTFLILMLGAAAFVVGLPLRDRGLGTILLNSVIGSLIVGVSLAALVLLQNAIGDMRFVFQNFQPLAGSQVTFGYEGDDLIFPGLAMLIGFSLLIGALSAIIINLSGRLRMIVLINLVVVVVIGLLETQITNIITLADAVALVLAFGAGYAVVRVMNPGSLPVRVGIGLGVGVAVGVLLSIFITDAILVRDSWLVGEGDIPLILGGTYDNTLLIYVLIYGVMGAVGGLITAGVRLVHDGTFYLFSTLLVTGLLNYQDEMNLLVAGFALVVFSLVQGFAPVLGEQSEQDYERFKPTQQTASLRLSSAFVLLVLLVAPIFLGLNLTNILDTVALFIVMGIGLNVMVGFAGLLDLGYVASFAIGAYTVGLLTTPSFFTTGCMPVDVVSQYEYYEMCTGVAANWQGVGVLSFWAAWPMAILVSALTGAALGIPVLRLRGDYLAIVTLGFGQIVGVMVKSTPFKPLLGGPGGITNIPVPTLDLTALNPDWFIEFNNATSIYYLYLLAVLVTAFVVLRLAGSRLGRAWRAMRADEDVAEATGIHLVRTKLLAFGISSAFAGFGGAIFVALLRGAVPTSFDIEVSINVLSLIIIGGLGSIPGVVLGAFVLVGLPEALREFADYRLLLFGVLLVVVMVTRPKGLLPPQPRELSKMATVNPGADEGENRNG